MCENNLQAVPLKTLISIRGYHGEEDFKNWITYIVPVTFWIWNHEEKIWLYMTNIVVHDIILGWPWIKLHEIIPDYKEHRICFTAETCPENYLKIKTWIYFKLKLKTLQFIHPKFETWEPQLAHEQVE